MENTSTRTSTSTSTSTIIIFSAVIIIVIWIIVKFVGFYGSKTTTIKNYTPLIKDITRGTVANVISGTTIPTSNFSNEYALSFWIHVDDYTYRFGQPKTVMIRGENNTVANPKITLGDKSNVLSVQIALQTQDPNNHIAAAPMATVAATTAPTMAPTAAPTGAPTAPAIQSFMDTSGLSDNSAPLEAALYDDAYFQLVSGEGVDEPAAHTHALADLDAASKESFDVATPSDAGASTMAIGTCSVAELPLQKWVHVVVSVYNNVVDIYIDGKLASSCIMAGFPMASTANLRIVPDGGFNGSMANLVAVNAALNPSEVQKLYNDGPVYSAGFLTTLKSYF